MKGQSGKPVSKPGGQRGKVEQEARACPVCGTKFSSDSDCCPVCILRGAAREQFATDEEAGPEFPWRKFEGERVHVARPPIRKL